jgi:hypothetical protein
MSGRHSGQHKKKKTPRETPLPVRNYALCQEHPDNSKECEMQEAKNKIKPSWMAGAALIVSILVLLVYLAQFYIMRETMRMEQRPWLFQDLVTAPTSAKVNEPIAVDFEMINTGKTTALQVEAMVMIGKVDYWHSSDLSQAFKVAFIQQYGNVNQGVRTANYPPVFWRKETTAGPTPVLPTDSDVNDLIEGKSFIQIWGEIDYRDVFGQQHWTRFCEWKALGPIPAFVDYTTVLSCVKSNDVDKSF